MPTASSGFELLKLGQPVPDGKFVDQDGKPVTLEDFRGSALIVTFIYTSCPMPTFCPLMDRHFATIQ
jgi:protein SCO1/2